MDNRYNLIIDNEPKILFEPKILWRFLLENKFLPDNGFFDLEPINYVYQEYKDYVNQHNLQMVSLTKNLDSFFNKMYLRDHEYFCYQIKEIEPNEFKKLIDQLYKDYQKKNKYSTPSGFIKKDNTITLIKNMIDSILEDIETTKFRQIHILPNETNVFIHKTPLINLYTTKLNQIELFEYLNLISQVIENFEPEIKDQKKTPHQPDTKEPNRKPPHDYYIILEMLATNEIEIFDKEIFKYKGKTYENASHLDRLINSEKTLKPAINFKPYLHQFKNKTGDKYILKTNDIDGKPDIKLIERLRKFKKYAQSRKLNIVNQDFKDAFKNI